MARIGIGYLDVAKAAVMLKEQGINPTVEEVRKSLGSGSTQPRPELTRLHPILIILQSYGIFCQNLAVIITFNDVTNRTTF